MANIYFQGSTEPENSTSEEKVSDKAMPPAPPCEGTSKKRKGTWKGQEQGELLNPSYKQDRNSVFKDEKLLETIKASEASEEKIIHKTGLLGEQELELEMGSDRYVDFRTVEICWMAKKARVTSIAWITLHPLR